MVKHMHSFCSSPSAVVKPQIHSVSSIKRREGRRRRRGEEAGEQKLGFATVPSSYFIDVGRHRKRAAFTLACRVLLLARESKTISDFEKYGGSWRSHSRAGISRLCAATLSALHLGGQHSRTFDQRAQATTALERQTTCAAKEGETLASTLPACFPTFFLLAGRCVWCHLRWVCMIIGPQKLLPRHK